MTAPRSLNALGRPRAHAADVAHVERASPLITEIGDDLDQRLASEPRATERLRLLREATNRITRTANDAVHAYRRAHRALELELKRADADEVAVRALQARLKKARLELLHALDVADLRYPSRDSDGDD